MSKRVFINRSLFDEVRTASVACVFVFLLFFLMKGGVAQLEKDTHFHAQMRIEQYLN